MGRLLVLLTTLLVLVMPVTEHLCNWDHFLRGGQDVEFNLLAGLLFAAMVVLSMSGTLMQPLLMQPAINGSCEQKTPPHACGRRESSQSTPRTPLRSQMLDECACASRGLTPLRI